MNSGENSWVAELELVLVKAFPLAESVAAGAGAQPSRAVLRTDVGVLRRLSFT